MVEGDSLQCLDRPRRCGANLAFCPVQLHPRQVGVYHLPVGHRREQVGPEEDTH